MSSAAFIEPLPVVEFVAQLLGKDVMSRHLSDSDRIKVLFQFYILFKHRKHFLSARILLYTMDLIENHFIPSLDHVCQVKKALRGVKVEVTHRRNVRRKYRISGLTSQPTRELV